MHTYTHTPLTHRLDINIYIRAVEAKWREEHRECQVRGGDRDLIKSIQITFEQKRKNKVSNYRNPRGITFQELKS